MSDAKVHSTWRGEITDEVRAIEIELGTNPSGVSSTVATRLATMDTTISGSFTTLENSKVDKAGDTMTGQLSGITPTAAAHLSRKDYIDSGIATSAALKLNLTGGTMTGGINGTAILLTGGITAAAANFDNVQVGGDAESRIAGAVVRDDGVVVNAITNTAGSTDATANGTWHREGTGGGQPGAVGGIYHSFRRGGTQIGSITIETGPVVAYNTTSDERLKTDIGLADEDGLATVARIIIRRYQREDGTEHVGVFAQELVDVIPQAVTPGGDDPHNDPWSVAYSNENIIGQIALAVQQIADRVALLEAA